ncbi:MAG: DUF4296 domain-containing protein [Prolixibacteraceae bacterium]
MRLRHFFLLLAIGVMLVSCGRQLPDGVLPAKKMVPIIVDIHLSEAINGQKFNMSIVRDSLVEELYLSICQKYKVERSAIEKSLLYYGKHTGEFVPIYDEALNVLSEMEVKAKNDTLRPAHVGGFDLDTTKTRKSPSPEVKGALLPR